MAAATPLRTTVSWTGGKDCNLALLRASEDPRYDVVQLVVFHPKVLQCRLTSFDRALVNTTNPSSPSYCTTVVAVRPTGGRPELDRAGFFEAQDPVFEAHPIPISAAQAEAVGLPVRYVEVGSEPSYRESYVEGMRRLALDDGIQAIVTGVRRHQGLPSARGLHAQCVDIGDGHVRVDPPPIVVHPWGL